MDLTVCGLPHYLASNGAALGYNLFEVQVSCCVRHAAFSNVTFLTAARWKNTDVHLQMKVSVREIRLSRGQSVCSHRAQSTETVEPCVKRVDETHPGNLQFCAARQEHKYSFISCV